MLNSAISPLTQPATSSVTQISIYMNIQITPEHNNDWNTRHIQQKNNYITNTHLRARASKMRPAATAQAPARRGAQGWGGQRRRGRGPRGGLGRRGARQGLPHLRRGTAQGLGGAAPARPDWRVGAARRGAPPPPPASQGEAQGAPPLPSARDEARRRGAGRSCGTGGAREASRGGAQRLRTRAKTRPASG